MKKQILSFIFLLAFGLVSAQDRNAIWIHGFGDNADFWNDEFSRAQRDFRIRSAGFTIRTDQGVRTYANTIRSRANSQGLAANSTIAIGHSMGGVAIRQMDRDQPNLFGGAITFGAPLDGARIANEIRTPGSIDRFFNSSVEILRSGPIASAARSRWQQIRDAIGGLIRGNIQSVVIRTVFSGPLLDVTDELSGGLEGVVNGFNPNDPSVADLAENSAYMRGIENFSSPKPKILVWGNEQSPVHARLFASDITDDPQFRDLILAAYNTTGQLYQTAADGINVGGFLCFRRCRDRKRREKEAWQAGADYLERGWEIAWNDLIDARVRETFTTTEQVLVCDGGGIGISPILDEGPQTLCLGEFDPSNDCCRYETRTVTRTRIVTQPSDGFIKRSSQVGEESNWNGNIVQAFGVNHQEMNTNPRINQIFRDSFDGRINSFFRTTRR